ncbi:YQGE family putative transporter [Bacillus ectoiniformans]|uniref:MFS transporter n=1 Tax=Bacillus ectoiniformans TaxID=1494429 RepID=UPI00195EA236|nr:MFS transporter [Bacillus ectoiniformans]MBM7650034.1 YQGE family putative transporter [Bacillus ectoiniformans]
MTIIKKWFRHLDLTRDLMLLLIIGGLYSLSVALSNTFVNIYLWKQTGEFIDLAIYNLTVAGVQPIAFIIAGKCAKKVDRVIVLRAGVSILALFYIAVLYFGSEASNWLVLLGALLGLGYGFYWLAYNVLTFEITEPETRDFFNGFFGTLFSAGGMFGPIAAGFIISRFASFTGYFIVFGLSLAFFIAAVIFSLFLKRRPSDGHFQLVSVWRERSRNADWERITNAHFFQGLREGVFVFIISVFVFVTTGSELALGTYGLVYSGISFVSYTLATKFVKKPHRKAVILAGGIVLFLSLFLIISDLTFSKLLIYGAIIAVAYPFLLVPYISMTYDVIGQSFKAAEMRVEYIVIREVFLNAGRLVSILSFIAAITFFDEKTSIPILLMVLGAGHTLIYFCIRKVNTHTVRDLVH